MQKKDAEVVDRGAQCVVGSAGVLVLVVDDLLSNLVVGGAGLVHVLHLGLPSMSQKLSIHYLQIESKVYVSPR